MRDEWLFGIAPYAATALVPAVCLWRTIVGKRTEATNQRVRKPVARTWIAVAGTVALALVLIGHAALLFAPAAVLRWNQSVARLLTLEAVGLCLGAAALVGATSAVRRLVTATGAVASAWDLALLTLVIFEFTTGLGVALMYRWGSSWAIVTLAPYAISIVRFAPRVSLVATTPFLVRLHVFASFAIVGVAPFAAPGIVVATWTWRVLEWVRGRVSAAGVTIGDRVAAVGRKTSEAFSLSVEEES